MYILEKNLRPPQQGWQASIAPRKEISGNEGVVGKMVREGIVNALKQLKGSNAAIIYAVVVERMKNEGISIIDWLLRICNRCMKSGVVPEEWNAAYIIPVYRRRAIEENVQII